MKSARQIGIALAAFAAGLVVAGGVFVALACRAGPSTSHHQDFAAMLCSDAQNRNAGFQREMSLGMARMMEDMHSPGYTGNVDVDFMAMMIPHHAGAVDMARLVLQHGHDPATRQLAEEIIAGQTIEIESMIRRLATLRAGGAEAGVDAFPALGGTRGQ